MTVTVTVTQVEEVSCDDGDFTFCPDDYYARVKIGTFGYEESSSTEDQSPIFPNWTFARTVDSDLISVPIEIGIWDVDDGSANDELDISPNGTDLDLNVDLASGNWAGENGMNNPISQGAHAKIHFKISVTGRLDVDSDGIPDDVERFGLRDGNGNLVADIAALGADPCRKTIAVEIDFMEQAGLDHTHRPRNEAIAEAVAAYNAAPVPAVSPCPYAGFPAQPSGINFVVDVDDALPHQAVLGWENGGEATRDANFDSARRPFFHYSLWVHDRASNTSSSGVCCSDSGKDVIVSLGSWFEQRGTVRDQSGTLMHELGHALVLGHGGGDGINCKPNYLSVMSYTLQVTGIPDPTLPAPNVDLDRDGIAESRLRLDYSGSDLPDLDESKLVEASGIGDGTDLTFWSADATTLQTAAGNGPIDWDVDGSTDSNPVAVDINNLGFGGCGLDSNGAPVPSPGELLTGFDDWSNLKLRAALSPDAGFAPQAPTEELDFESAELLKAELLQELTPDPSLEQSAAPGIALTGSNVTYTLTVKNEKLMPATGIVVTDHLPAAVTFVSCAATGGGVCGGTGNDRTVTFASLAGAAAATITLVAQVRCPVADGTTIVNTAIVSSSSPDADPGNNSSQASIVASNPPPIFSNVSVDRPQLWPPNHKMVDVTVGYEVSDNCGTAATSLRVISNEPINGTGDGDSDPDWQVLDAHHLRLRAERSGKGSGRIYTITITARDSGGGSTTKAVLVTVPKSGN